MLLFALSRMYRGDRIIYLSHIRNRLCQWDESTHRLGTPRGVRTRIPKPNDTQRSGIATIRYRRRLLVLCGLPEGMTVEPEDGILG